MLETAYAFVARESSAYTVLVTGPAGSGKSRLVGELLAGLERRGEGPEVVLYGRAEARSAEEPFALLASVLRRATGIEGGEAAAERRDKLTRRLGQSLDAATAARVSEVLGALVDESAGAGERGALSAEAMSTAWEAWLSAECAAGPLMLLLDAVHWADGATVRVVGRMLRELAEKPLLLVAMGGIEEQLAETWNEMAMLTVPIGEADRPCGYMPAGGSIHG
ncbi:MAG: ATP-binding protein [Minicystis sp.]